MNKIFAQTQLEALESRMSHEFAHTLALANGSTTIALKRMLGRNTDLLGQSTKTLKEDASIVSTKILYLLPHKSAGVKGVNLCPSARNCIKSCLVSAGRGRMAPVQAGRYKKSMSFIRDNQIFVALLIREIDAHIKACKAKNITPAFRLNGTSDIEWAALWQYITLNGGQAYEYTKRADMARNHAGVCDFTYSYQGLDNENWEMFYRLIIQERINIAVVFKDALPDAWLGFEVYDGDLNDNRFTDPKGLIIGLLAKGKAKQEKNRFVVNV